jgi:two-component system, chemotaxis family, sensor histidine kinase and response regulator PixL
MNGFEFLGHMQKLPNLSHIPVLILSSRSDHSHRSLASQLGATAYMTKPYIEHKLLAAITNLLQQTLLNTVPE